MRPSTPWSPAKTVRRAPLLGQAPQPSVNSGTDTVVPAFAFTGIKPEDVRNGVLISLGGAAVAAASSMHDAINRVEQEKLDAKFNR